MVACAALLLVTAGWAADEARTYNDQGLKEYNNANYQEAFKLLMKAKNLKPDWAEPYYNLALVMDKVKKPRDYRLGLEKAWKLEPNNTKYQEAYVKILKEELAALKPNQATEKEELSKKILEVDASQIEMAAAMVRSYLDKKDYGNVRNLANRVFEKNREQLPKYANGAIGDIYYALGKAEYESNKLAEARANLEKSLRYPVEKPDVYKETLNEVKKAQTSAAEGHLKLGQSFQDKGQGSEALAEFKKGLVILPDHEGLQEAMRNCEGRGQAKVVFADAMKAIKDGHWIKARDLLQEVMVLQPDYPEAKGYLDKAIEKENKVREKIGRTSELPRYVEERASLVEGFITIGNEYLRVNNQRDARTEFEKALAIVELDPELNAKYKGQIDAAMKTMNDTSSLEDKYRAGVKAYESKDWDAVIDNLTKLPDEKYLPQDLKGRGPPDIPSYLAMAYFSKGNFEDAKKLAGRQINIDPRNNRAKFVLAHIYFNEKNLAAAEKLITEIREDDPNYPGIDEAYTKMVAMNKANLVIPLLIIGALFWIAYILWQNLPKANKNRSIRLGRSLLNKGLYREAIDEILKVRRSPLLEKEDHDKIARILAEAFLKTAQYDKAVGECKTLLGMDPNDNEAKVWLGYAFLGRRSLNPESLPLLMNLYKTIEKEKKNASLLGMLGDHFVSSKVLTAEGIEILERWLELEPNNPDCVRALGKYYLKKGRNDATAMKLFEQMMTLENLRDPEIILGIGKVHLRMDNFDETLRCCDTVLNSDVNNELVHGLLRECYQKMDKLDELLKIYRNFLAENPYNVAFQKGLQAAQKAAGGAGAGAAQAPRPALSVDQPAAAIEGPAEGDGQSVACPHCGAANAGTDYYCQACGKTMDGSA